jgi:dihydroorotate dehydrogenase (NAD+) catalytic subunit
LEKLPALNALGLPVIANFSGESVGVFEKMAIELSKAGVKIMELNISCPNIKRGGQVFASSADDTHEVVRAVRQVLPDDVILIVKLSPMVLNGIEDIAEAAEAAGADILSLSNTILGMKIDLRTRRPAIGNIFGGMSGPGVAPINVRLVYNVSRRVSIPVIASTGVERGADAAEYLIVGAKAIAVGEAILHNPDVGIEIFQELQEIIASYGMRDIKELVGSLIL